MAGGPWSPTEEKVRPGFYMNFVAAALAAIAMGARGIVAIPVKANWGPKKTAVEISSEAELIEAFENDTNGFTAYKLIRLILLGGAKTVLGYRLVDGAEAKAALTLKDGAGTNVITLNTKYETERSFKVTVRDNPVDTENLKDILLYEGLKLLYTFTFAKGATIVDAATETINNDPGNKWIDAVQVAVGNGTLADVSSQALTGGNAGAAAVTNADYTVAMTAFEAREFNIFCLDGMTDSALQTSVAAWIARLRNEGKGVVAVMGGSASDDANIATANTRSQSFNYEGIINVGVSGVLDGVTYPSAEVACWVAGKMGGQKLKESLTYANAVFDDVSPRLTHNQVVAALKAGTIVLVHDGEKVKIEQGINTLTSLSADQNNQWKKIKAIRVMDAINTDLLKAAQDNYIGKVNNDDDGQAALLSAYKQYMDVLVDDGLVKDDYTVGLNPEFHPIGAAAEEVYPLWSASIVDSMEKIFGTFVVK